jgi:glutaminyl-peptide cyclotransferase
MTFRQGIHRAGMTAKSADPERPRPRRNPVAVLCFCVAATILAGCTPATPKVFSGSNAYALAEEFLAFGPRVTGTEANRRAGDWIAERLTKSGWDASYHEGIYKETPVRNIVGAKGTGPVVILGAHFDSRRCADMPSGGCAEPVLGADDGASGVAVLLELARTLEPDWNQVQVRLVFFDAEDNGGLDGWDWIVGSRQYALRVREEMASGTEFRYMILFDMVADADQSIYWDGNSDPALRGEIWSVAEQLGYREFFIPSQKFTMLDDHLPFRDLGIPSVDIIDFDYPYWHTNQDTLDKISAESLERVGRTAEAWLEGLPPGGTRKAASEYPAENGFEAETA